MRTILAALLVPLSLTACATDMDPGGGEGNGPVIGGDDEKADGEIPIEVSGRIRPGQDVDGALTSRIPRTGWIMYATKGSRFRLDITHAGSSSGLDTVMKVYGPRRPDGSYPEAFVSDDDTGYAKLSRLAADAPADGVYLVEVSAKAPPASNKKFRLDLSCTGSCDSESPFVLGLDLRWITRSAEARASRLQAYALASERLEALDAQGGLPSAWAVVMDLDETTIDNSAYQVERAQLGVGYSGPSWLAWVNRKAAPAVPGAKDFIATAHRLGGKVVFVTNRKKDGECGPTEANLAALGISYDALLCKTDSSDKNPRFAQVASGDGTGLGPLEVVTFVGDNILDFPALSQDLRHLGDDQFAEFGARFTLIPNPMYGSFEKNID